jgi:ABC-type Fe3+-hydroxamate transport system substrate-binding protein
MRLLILLVCLTPLPSFASRTVTDELGRKVVVPDHPHRLVCLIPSVVDDVYALGAGSDVVAVSDFTKYPAAASAKPSIGLPSSPSLEMILSLHPDLVLGSGDSHGIQIVDQLQQYGIPVFMVDPHGIAGIYKSLHSLGMVLDRESSANDLIARLHSRERAVRERAQGKPVVHIFMPIWYDPVMTIGKHAFITELIEAAGGQSVTSDISQEWPQVSLETIIARAPDAILLVKGSKMSLKDLSTRPGWSSLEAVRMRHIDYVDNKIDFPSPVAFDAMEELAKQFYP